MRFISKALAAICIFHRISLALQRRKVKDLREPYERLEPSPSDVERMTDLKVCIRGVRWDDRRVKGKLRQVNDVLYVEFRDDNPGYFWHIDTVRKLLHLAMLGCRNVELYDESDRLKEDA
ncbi:MAG: hypothetical protein RMK18_05495 [Armatimonadota bacterium]|nr:hypothetical protein [Armatimonadota bacterium]MDW8025305.1 hypothetical protein [Armatimonadota bacterium]